MPLPLGPLLLVKEAADFIQIGLVAWQTGRRFSGQRPGRGGSVTVDGGTVRVQYGGQVFDLPIEEAAATAGVGGAAGRPRPGPTFLQRVGVAAQRAAQATLQAGVFGAPLMVFSQRGQVAEAAPRGPVEVPDVDSRPFGLREFVLVQEMGKDRRQQAAVEAERELELLRQQFQERLAAAKTDLERERIRLEYGDRIAAREAALGQLRERLAAEERQIALRAQLQGQLETAEREWKSREAALDREWRARQAAAQAEQGFYYQQLAADLAAWRKVETEKKLAEAKARRTPLGPPGFALGRIAKG
jgi:hypothetical protein